VFVCGVCVCACAVCVCARAATFYHNTLLHCIFLFNETEL